MVTTRMDLGRTAYIREKIKVGDMVYTISNLKLFGPTEVIVTARGYITIKSAKKYAHIQLRDVYFSEQNAKKALIARLNRKIVSLKQYIQKLSEVAP